LSTALVLAETNLDLLRRLATEGNRLGRRWIAAPLIMSPAFIRESLDSFPLELLDIQQQHRMIFGADPFPDLPFQREHVRLQCERECKVMLTRIRQGILGAAGRESMWAELAAGVAEQLVRTLRGMNWLRGVAPVGPVVEVLQHSQEAFGRTWTWVGDAMKGVWDGGWSGVEVIYGDIEQLAQWADGGLAGPTQNPTSGDRQG
jgi:hypothetical protein